MALPRNLPSAVWNQIISLSVPEDRYEFMGSRGSRDAVWAKNPMQHLIRELWHYPILTRQINELLYSRSRFEFISSNVSTRRHKCVHACEVAVQFLSQRSNMNQNVGGNTGSLNIIGYLRNIYCDVNWEKRVETVDIFFQMLSLLATNADPPRYIRYIPFVLEHDDDAKRSRRGVRAYQPQCFALRGFITLDIKLFIVKLGSSGDHTFDNLNQWVRQRHVASSPFDHLRLLPTEISTQLYLRHLQIPQHHTIGPTIMQNPSLSLLQICRPLSRDLLPILYASCCFEFVQKSKLSYQHRDTQLDDVDEAWWAMCFLERIGRGNAHHIHKVKIVIEVPPPDSEKFTPSIRRIIEYLDSYCGFQIIRNYETVHDGQITITSVAWNPHIRRLCFEVKLPDQERKIMMVEIQTKWNTEQTGTLAHDTQLEVIRQVFRASMEGLRFKVSDAGDIMPV